MKYLVQNKKEFAITVGVFAVNAYNLWKALKRGVVDEQTIAAFVFALLTLLGWYYNMPTSEENCRYTGAMRAEKEFLKSGTDGENFFDDIVEDSEEGEDS